MAQFRLKPWKQVGRSLAREKGNRGLHLLEKQVSEKSNYKSPAGRKILAGIREEIKYRQKTGRYRPPKYDASGQDITGEISGLI